MRLAAIALLLVAAPALAAPLAVKNGSSVNVSLAGKRERGIGLRPQASGWRLELSRPADDVAELIDVTRGVAPTKWVLPVEDGALHLDSTRFVPGHAYRVALRKGGSALVYLYPPAQKRTSQVTFADDQVGGGDDGGIAITPKSAL